MLLPGVEEVIAYLTHCEMVFVSTNLRVDRAMHASYSPPDVLALDFGCREVVIVDVAPAWDLTQLCRRIDERQERWCSPIWTTLLSQRMVTKSWTMRVLVLLPRTKMAEAREEFIGLEDVACWPLEEIARDKDEAHGSAVPRRPVED